MARLWPAAGVVGVVGLLAGCAGTWDTMTSRKFRQHPFEMMFRPGDPLEVLRTSPEGDERAAAMRRLKEPLTRGGGQEEQDEVLNHLSAAATNDPSPVVRAAAVDALGRFQDERAVGLLTAAYARAAGAEALAAEATIRQVSATEPGRLPEKYSLAGPQGFPPEVVAALQTRCVVALTKSGRPQAVEFLTKVATGAQGAEREVKLAAVRGLGHIRRPEAVQALAQVLAAEKGRDPALVGRAHDGLVSLTGQRLPADPEQWNQVVQAGAQVVPEPSAVERAILSVVP